MKFPFPFLHSLLVNFTNVLTRFPLAMLYAFTGTYAAILEAHLTDPWSHPFWIKVILCCEIGMLFAIAISTFMETVSKRKGYLMGSRIVLLLLTTAYFFSFPDKLLPTDWYRFILLAALGHLLVACAPFHGKGHINGFWHYNKSLFLRFLTAVLYSAVIFAGICAAMMALTNLFDIAINNNTYFSVWLLIAGAFNTCFFLAGIPKDPLSLDKEDLYPAGLKIFTQFVLIPLLSIYVIILLAYELKILAQWDLPRGWVANLLIAFAVFGILSLLLVFPVRNISKNKWITLYSKAFYWILLPLLALLFIAIGTRIKNYGFTEERFWVATIGIWLVFTAAYFISTSGENIKIIPSSLIVVIVIVLVIMTPICIKSQQNRLTHLLQEQHLLKDGKIITVNGQPNPHDSHKITSIVQYLYATYGKSAVQPFFNKDLDQLPASMKTYAFTDTVLNSVGIEPVYFISDSATGPLYISLYREDNKTINITGYDYLISRTYHVQGKENYQLGKHSASITFDKSRAHLTVTIQLDRQDNLHIPLDALIGRLLSRHRADGSTTIQDSNFVIAENNQMQVKLMISSLNGTLKKGSIDYTGMNIGLSYLIRIKK
ncbi:MAG TPA: DUF4153 domain-containing protein [Chitinophagaceae bacterium]|nr:DUF4153 domain-containing protein [Chitinophagaceae bacterium]